MAVLPGFPGLSVEIWSDGIMLDEYKITEPRCSTEPQNTQSGIENAVNQTHEVANAAQNGNCLDTAGRLSGREPPLFLPTSFHTSPPNTLVLLELHISFLTHERPPVHFSMAIPDPTGSANPGHQISSNSSFRFTDLPKELRLRVYEIDVHIDVVDGRNSPIDCEGHSWDVHKVTGCRSERPPNIAQVSRLIRAEVLPIYYVKNTLFLPIPLPSDRRAALNAYSDCKQRELDDFVSLISKSVALLKKIAVSMQVKAPFLNTDLTVRIHMELYFDESSISVQIRSHMTTTQPSVDFLHRTVSAVVRSIDPIDWDTKTLLNLRKVLIDGVTPRNISGDVEVTNEIWAQ